MKSKLAVGAGTYGAGLKINSAEKSTPSLESVNYFSDIHASGEYRASLVVTQAKKAVEAC